MSAASVTDQLCVYFGGPFETATRTYRTPQLTVPGLAMGVVRRAKPKRVDQADFHLGNPGVAVGCQIYVILGPGDEIREGAGGSTAGLKHARHHVTMDCLLRSESAYAEDVQDGIYALLQAIIDRIHADRTCGSGGVEAGGFHIDERGPPWLHWMSSDVVSTAERSDALLRVSYVASEYLIAGR